MHYFLDFQDLGFPFSNPSNHWKKALLRSLDCLYGKTLLCLCSPAQLLVIATKVHISSYSGKIDD